MPNSFDSIMWSKLFIIFSLSSLASSKADRSLSPELKLLVKQASLKFFDFNLSKALTISGLTSPCKRFNTSPPLTSCPRDLLSSLKSSSNSSRLIFDCSSLAHAFVLWLVELTLRIKSFGRWLSISNFEKASNGLEVMTPPKSQKTELNLNFCIYSSKDD